jgi:hypothetical protein
MGRKRIIGLKYKSINNNDEKDYSFLGYNGLDHRC